MGKVVGEINATHEDIVEINKWSEECWSVSNGDFRNGGQGPGCKVSRDWSVIFRIKGGLWGLRQMDFFQNLILS